MVTCNFTLHLRIHDHTTWFWRCVGMAFGHFLLGSHDFMVMALGSCVKWPFMIHPPNWCLPLNPPLKDKRSRSPQGCCATLKLESVESSILFVQFIPNAPSILVHWRDLIAHSAILAIYVMTRTPFQYTKKSTIILERGWPIIDQILNPRPYPL